MPLLELFHGLPYFREAMLPEKGGERQMDADSRILDSSIEGWQDDFWNVSMDGNHSRKEKNRWSNSLRMNNGSSS